MLIQRSNVSLAFIKTLMGKQQVPSIQRTSLTFSIGMPSNCLITVNVLIKILALTNRVTQVKLFWYFLEWYVVAYKADMGQEDIEKM